MSILKDLWFYLPAAISLYFFAKYMVLKKHVKNERDFFINTLSHDFKVAIIAQIRGLEILKKNNSDNCYINTILENAKFTLDIADVLLSVFKEEDGKIIYYPENLEVSKILNTAFDDNRTSFFDKNIAFELANVSDTLFCDRKSIANAFKILFSTALVYSSSNDKIVCKSCKNGLNTKITIQYTGRLLSYEEKARMFCKNTIYSAVGQGLKMYLCKKIIELNNGKIEIVSDDNNITSFVITLPRAGGIRTQKTLNPLAGF